MRGWPPLFAEAVQVSSHSCSYTECISCSREWPYSSLEGRFYGDAALEYVHSTLAKLASPKMDPRSRSPQWDGVWRRSLWEGSGCGWSHGGGALFKGGISAIRREEMRELALSALGDMARSLTVLPPRPWTSGLQNQEKIILFCLSPVYDVGFGSPCWLIHTESKCCYTHCIKR